jgi:rRNA maturation endonuclease Nob1
MVRDVNYNGNELMMNTYQCSNCKNIYRFEHIHHDFCHFCGSLYKFKIDISI